MKEITIVVDKGGRVTIDYSGFKGDECFEVAQRIYELLKKYGVNVNVEYTEKKPEAYIKEKTVEKVGW